MKKSFILTILSVILCFGQVYAKPVDEQTARAVGRTFLLTGKTTLTQVNSLDLVYRAVSKSGNPMAAAKAVTYYYVFNINGDKGFVIVSGDDAVTPVLGYSGEGKFNPSDMAPNVSKWLEGYKDEIRYAIETKLPATSEITNAWEQLKQGNAPADASNNTKRGKRAVSPLVQTKWNQAPYYNAMCPYDNGSAERTVTGCVATAMAQVMKYWNYPENGSGFHSYNHNSYGTLSANFGTTTYQWSSMTNTVSSNNSAVATLMYQVGVSVDMNYGVGSSGGSGAYVITDQSPVEHCSEYALKNYFGYKSSLQGVQRANYTQTQWLNLIIAEMDASRPVIYAGFGSGGGHCFVADGYDNNNYVHFNWGWGGAYDGYFSINALNPAGVGTGGGTGGFNSGHQAIIGLEPPSGGGGGGGGTDYDMRVYNNVTPSSSTIYYGQSFSVSTNIANLGTSNFSGDYTAAIFDNQNNFIDHVEVKTGQTLDAGFAYNNDLLFENAGMLGMLPGTYTIIMFYRPDGGNWIQLGDYNSYNNLAQITVINPGSIELNSAMSVTPVEALVKDKTASVNLNLLNNSGNTFTGSYMVGLYTLEGAYVQTIGSYDENTGLPNGYTYQSPYLTFDCPAITADPGTYLLAVLHQATGSGSWSLTGSTNFQNPVKVTVIENTLPPDQYEVNNTPGTATNLAITFSGNAAAKTTIGSTCHTGSDYDYYKINLNAGYNYTVNARIHDLYNSGNGKTYTLDALFSYSTDGSSWSDAYDYAMPGAITVNGQGTVYFQVAPYFTGNMGTYLLDISVTRALKVGLESTLADMIAVYPNPAKELVSVDLKAFEGSVSNIQLVNLQGQAVYTAAWQNGTDKTDISLQQLAAGVYFLQLQTDKGTLSKKIIVNQ